MSSVPADVNYTFSDAQIETLKSYGEVRAHAEGDVLTQEGQTHQDFLVTLSGFFIGVTLSAPRWAFGHQIPRAVAELRH